MYLARELTDATLPAIGRAFGGRNHTTVLHACRRTAERIAADPEAYDAVRRLTASSKRRAVTTGAPDRLGVRPQRPCARRPRISAAVGGLVHSIHTPDDEYLIILDFVGTVTSMKLSTRRDALFAQLQTVTRAASTRSAVQALSGVQIAARRAAAIELRATDMEIGLRVPLEGEVVREGAVVLPARLLVDVVRALPGRPCRSSCAPSEQDVEIVAGSATFHIRTLRARGLPAVPGAGGRAAASSVPARRVRRDGRSRSPARPRATRRGPVLTGILVSAAGDELRMVATDSYRLSVKETKLEAPLDGSFEANVPARALQELSRIVAARRRRAADGRASARTRSSSRPAASSCPRG